MMDIRDILGQRNSFVQNTLPEPVLPYLPAIAGLGLLAIGAVFPHYLTLLNRILILGIFAISFNILFGYTGLLSFGHAAFFGLGAYSLVLISNETGLTLLPILFIVLLLGAVLSIAMGLIALRSTGIYFAMITLAVAQLIYILVTRLGDFVGGSSGLSLSDRPQMLIPLDITVDFQFYLLVVVILVAVYYLFRRILRSPVGDVFRAVRENEERTRFLGYSVFQYKLASLVVSGAFSALAGGLYALFIYFATPSFFYWTTSGDVLLQTLFGGMGTLFGPLVGSGFVVLIEEFLSPITDRWFFFVGVAFVLVIIFLPEGITGLFTTSEE